MPRTSLDLDYKNDATRKVGSSIRLVVMRSPREVATRDSPGIAQIPTAPASEIKVVEEKRAACCKKNLVCIMQEPVMLV